MPMYRTTPAKLSATRRWEGVAAACRCDDPQFGCSPPPPPCRPPPQIADMLKNPATADRAKDLLAARLADSVVAFVEVQGDGFADSSGVAEPSPDCRRKLNTWMTDCVFGP